jgi:hypothetical protein
MVDLIGVLVRPDSSCRTNKPKRPGWTAGD